MYDWKAKLEELRGAIELTDEQKNELALGVSWAMWKVNGSPVEDTRRAELSIRNQLERLIEAHWDGYGIWEVGRDEFSPHESTPYKAFVGVIGDFTRGEWGATPTQALMDALLSVVEEAPNA